MALKSKRCDAFIREAGRFFMRGERAVSGTNLATLGGFHAKGEGAFEHDFHHGIAVAEADFLQNLRAVLGEKGDDERVGKRTVHATHAFEIENEGLVNAEGRLDVAEAIFSRAGTFGKVSADVFCEVKFVVHDSKRLSNGRVLSSKRKRCFARMRSCWTAPVPYQIVRKTRDQAA